MGLKQLAQLKTEFKVLPYLLSFSSDLTTSLPHLTHSSPD